MLGEGGAKSCRREKLDRYGELTEEGGGFAVAVRADDREVLARLELKAHIFYDRPIAEINGEV